MIIFCSTLFLSASFSRFVFPTVRWFLRNQVLFVQPVVSRSTSLFWVECFCGNGSAYSGYVLLGSGVFTFLFWLISFLACPF
jgi:hypothetical protein